MQKFLDILGITGGGGSPEMIKLEEVTLNYHYKFFRYVRFVLIILIGVLILIRILYGIAGIPHTMTSDDSVEAIFTKEILDTGDLLPLSWFYTTEIRIWGPHLLMLPVLATTGNLLTAHIAGILTISILLGVSVYFFLRYLQVGTSGLYAAVIILSGISPIINEVIYRSTLYNPYIIAAIILIWAVMEGMTVQKRSRFWLMITVALVTSTAINISGARAVYSISAPLFLAILYQTCAGNLQGNPFFINRRRGLFLLGIIIISTITGYLVNKYLLAAYSVGTAGDITVFAGIKLLVERITQLPVLFLHLLGMLGEEKSGLFTLRGALTVIQFGAYSIILGLIVYGCLRVRRFNSRFQFFWVFSIASVIMAFLPMWLLKMYDYDTYSARYFLIAAFFLIFLIPIIHVEFILPRRDNFINLIFLFLILASCCLPVFNNIYSIFKDENTSYRDAADYLRSNGYHRGYASFWNAVLIMEFSNAEVIITPVQPPSRLPVQIAKWGTSSRFMDVSLNSGPFFFLLKGDEELPERDLQNAVKVTKFNEWTVLEYRVNPIQEFVFPVLKGELRKYSPVLFKSDIGRITGDTWVSSGHAGYLLKSPPFNGLGTYTISVDYELLEPRTTSPGFLAVTTTGGELLIREDLAPGLRQVSLTTPDLNGRKSVVIGLFSNEGVRQKVNSVTIRRDS